MKAGLVGSRGTRPEAKGRPEPPARWPFSVGPLAAGPARATDASPARGATTGSLAGQTVSRYGVLAKLGSGASGEACKAEHLSPGIPMAFKLIHPRNPGDPHTRVRFAREAKAAAGTPRPVPSPRR